MRKHGKLTKPPVSLFLLKGTEAKQTTDAWKPAPRTVSLVRNKTSKFPVKNKIFLS